MVQVLTASIDGKVKVWDLRQPNKPVYNMNITEDEVTGQSNKASKSYLRSFDICHPVRPQFMCAFKDIYLYRKIESKEMKHKAHSNAITGIGYDAKHGSILTSSGCSVYTWSILTGKLQREFRDIAKSSISCMLVDSTSGLFYIGTEFGSIQVCCSSWKLS
jgi:WD40 repeat protein